MEEKAYEQALALYQGDLFPRDRYADWAVWERERLALAYLHALLAAGEIALSERKPQQALKLAQKALAQEPWQEQAVRIGMEACALLRDRATALRLYRNLAERLSADLNIEPGPALQTLYRLLSEGT